MLNIVALILLSPGLPSAQPGSLFQKDWHYADVEAVDCPASVDRAKAAEAATREYRSRPAAKGDPEIVNFRIQCARNAQVILASSFLRVITDVEVVYQLNDRYQVIGKYLRSPYGKRRWD